MKIRPRKTVLVLFVISALLAAALVLWLSLDGKTKPAEQTSGLWNNVTGGDVITVGVFASKQGDFAAYGRSIEQGAMAALEVINARDGILGRPVRIEVVDPRSQPALIRPLAEELVQKNKAALLVGTAGEEETLAAADAAADLGVPFIYVANGPLKTCSRRDRNKKSPFVWGAGLTWEMYLEPFLIYLGQTVTESEREPKFFFFASDTALTAAQAQSARETSEELGFKTVGFEIVDERIRDYYQDINQIFLAQPDILFVLTSQRATPVFFQQMAKMTVQRDMTVAALETLEEERLRQFGASGIDNYLTANRYTHLIKTPENEEFLAAWRKLFPGTPDQPTATAAAAYGSLLIAKAAFEKAKSTAAEPFAKAMNTTQVVLPQGRVAVDPHNNLFIQPLYLLKLSNGQYEVVEYLGDVSHPGLNNCAVERAKE